MNTFTQKQAATPAARRSRFNFQQKRLAQAIRLAFLSGAASALPAAAICSLDNSTLATSLTFADTCAINGALTIDPMGYLTNNGAISNQGLIDVYGRLRGNGTLINLGQLRVNDGADVAILNSGNWDSKAQTLTGGRWLVSGVNAPSKLSVGSGLILTNAADITLSGANANFAQLSGLQSNQGSLRIEQGKVFTSASLYNTGTIISGPDGQINIAASKNFDGKTLSGGTWQVYGGTDAKKVGLTIGSGSIAINAANVLLSGVTANFSQINNLTTNTGTLSIADGRVFQLKSLENKGTLSVASGGKLTLTSSANLIGGNTLQGGRWEVYDGGTLTVGPASQAITRNAADVLLSGATASFAQMTGLTHNTGTLTLAAGYKFEANAAFTNEAAGRIVAGSGGVLNVTGSGLINHGVIQNDGVVAFASKAKYSGTGTLTNAGTLRLSDAAEWTGRATNLVGDTLTGGTWQVYGTGGIEFKNLDGSAAVVKTSNANILLSGSGGDALLASLTTNQGSLSVEGARSFVSASLLNTGTVTVGPGSSLTLTTSANLSKGTLSGGTWRVLGDVGAKPAATTLVVGKGAITVNAANVVLSGASATFAQLSGLTHNQGSLSIEGGRVTTLANLTNTGSLRAASGGQLTLTNSSNLASGVLTGGIWEVDNRDGASGGAGSSLMVGGGNVVTNNADIRLRGAGARFGDVTAATSSLKTNNGSLTISDGAQLKVSSFANEGTVTVASGAGLGLYGISPSIILNGTWRVLSDGQDSETAIGIYVNEGITSKISEIGYSGSVTLSGAKAHFQGLEALGKNNGTLIIQNGNTLKALSTDLTNTGTLVVGAGSTLSLVNSATGKGRSFIQNTEEAETQIDGLLEAGKVNINNGTLSGSGIVRAGYPRFDGVWVPGGITIAPDATVQPGGDAPGMLTLDGDVSFAGTLALDIDSPTSFDSLAVTGALTLTSTSKLAAKFNFAPMASSYSFQFLQTGSFEAGYGQFSSWSVSDMSGAALSGYDSDLQCSGTTCSLMLTAVPVPEPGSYAMLLAGLGMLGFVLRRRSRAVQTESAV